MKSIETRKDVNILVNEFYTKVRKDELLGSIFNNHIPEEQWDSHLQKLTDFWETILFGVKKFRGNPTQKHVNIDKNLNYGVKQEHFGRWLQLWFETINELYNCNLANIAKESARKMAHAQFMMIWNYRQKNIAIRH